MDPQPVPIVQTGESGLEAPDPNVIAANQGAVMWPALLAVLAPLPVLLGITGVAAVLVAVVGWLPSAPLPESLPGWPEHRGGI